MRTINAILADARQELYKHGTADELTSFLKTLDNAGGRTVDDARNLVTIGQFVRMLPLDPRRRVALAHYLFDSTQPNGVKCDLLCRIDAQYTKRAADGLVRKVQLAAELVVA